MHHLGNPAAPRRRRGHQRMTGNEAQVHLATLANSLTRPARSAALSCSQAMRFVLPQQF
jgi:hypothetical protein